MPRGAGSSIYVIVLVIKKTFKKDTVSFAGGASGLSTALAGSGGDARGVAEASQPVAPPITSKGRSHL